MPEDEQFSHLLKASFAELQMKTMAHQGGWGFGKFDRWELNQDQGDLVFSNKDGMTATCPAQIIGSYDSVGRTWLWAWANPSVPDSLKTASLKVKEYGEKHQIERLTNPKWAGEEMDAWAMTALAVKLCGSQGAYRGPAGTTAVFMTFSAVKLTKSESARRGWRWPSSR